MWILKATKLNQGQGIHVCNSLPQIKQLILKYCEGIPKKQTENFTNEKELRERRGGQENGAADDSHVDSIIQKTDYRARLSKSIKGSDARRQSHNKLKSNSSLLKLNAEETEEKAIFSESESR